VGEWWWVVRRGLIVPACCRVFAPGWYVFGEPHETWNVGPIARIPDPPAPEPTEAEKIDARREAVIARENVALSQRRCREIAREIRASDEAAGYVTVPREPSEAMVQAHIAECAGDADEADEARVRDCWAAMIEAANSQGILDNSAALSAAKGAA